MTAQKLDEIQIGSVISTESFKMTDDQIKKFAAEFDPQAMHLDEVAAERGPFGRLTASGWHTLSIAMRLMALAKPFGEVPLVGVGVTDIQFLKPVFANETVFVEAVVESKRASSKPGRGFVKLNLTVRNRETNEAVLTETWTVLVPA